MVPRHDEPPSVRAAIKRGSRRNRATMHVAPLRAYFTSKRGSGGTAQPPYPRRKPPARPEAIVNFRDHQRHGERRR